MVVADVPQLINYQGILLDTGSSPVTTAANVTFTIYDDATAGVAPWTASRSVSPDVPGQFNIIMGDINPLDDGVFAVPDRQIPLPKQLQRPPGHGAES